MGDVEPKVVAERVRFIFGDVAERILKIEEEKLGISPQGPLGEKDLTRLAEDLKELSARMAGEEMAKRVHQEILALAAGPTLSSEGHGASAGGARGRRSP
jgi:hypothetical protein